MVTTNQNNNNQTHKEANDYTVLALYKFENIPSNQVQNLRNELETRCRNSKAMGCIIVSHEGLNGTICYPSHCSNPLESLKYEFGDIQMTFSKSKKQIFHRLKIKTKNEIVTMGQDVNPLQAVGTYIQPGPAWDALIQDPDIVVIDTRNHYEVQLGTFHNAIDPHTESFRDFPAWLQNFSEALKRKPKGVAMFCTGGIRCEKATSYALSHKVFEDTPIYHLKGGILSYLQKVPSQESHFDGECYVFDQRVTVKHGLEPGEGITMCFGCRMPLKQEDLEDEKYCEGVSCRYCYDGLSKAQLERFHSRQKQIEIAKQRGVLHIHDPKYTHASDKDPASHI